MRKRILSAILISALLVTSLAGCNENVETSSKIEEQQSKPTDSNKPAESGSPEENSSSEENSGLEESSNPVTPQKPDYVDADAAWKQTLTYADDTTLRMAIGYNRPESGIRFTSEVAGDGIVLADGKTYRTGDFKPTWQAVMDKLKFKIEDKYNGLSATKEWEYWRPQLDRVDLVSGTASQLNYAGNNGALLNIADYLDYMPYFSAFLKRNPIVRLSIAADTNKGAIYFTPYFDGVNDVKRMPLMRTDWVVKLLDGKGNFTPAKCGTTNTVVYQPYMPTQGKVTVDVVKKDGSGTEQITKDYDKAGNIVAKMNEAGAMSGVDAVNMLRKYIDEAYGNYYGDTRSDLFIGQNAAWDADELVALLRCVVSNAPTLNGTNKVRGIFARYGNKNVRRVDMYRLAGILFGVRGLESEYNYLYFGSDNKLHDARMEEDTYYAISRMNAMAQEGLISEAFIDMKEESSELNLQNDLGFMS